MNIFRFSLVETERLDRIEAQLRQANKKLDTLLLVSISPEQLVKLTQETEAASVRSAELNEALEHNKYKEQHGSKPTTID